MLASYSGDTGTLIVSPGRRILPTRVVFVLDTSSSMNDSSCPGNGELQMMSNLDVAKHAVLALAAGLPKGSLIGLVCFSGNARVVCGFVNSNEATEPAFRDRVLGVFAHGATNMWAGINQALIMHSQHDESCYAKEYNSAIVMLTDGSNNTGCEPALRVKAYYDDQDDTAAPCLCTVGFSYPRRLDGTGPDHQALKKLAEVSRGCYTFVSDGSMLGTAVNNLGAMLATLSGYHTMVSGLLESSEGHEGGPPGGPSQEPGEPTTESTTEESGDTQDLGIICGDFRRAYMIPPGLRASSLRLCYTQGSKQYCVQVTSDGVTTTDEYVQARLCKTLLNRFGSRDPKTYRMLLDVVVDCRHFGNDFANAMMDDMQGECRRAWDNFDTWGMPHLLSLMDAIYNRRQHNFKDKSVAFFVGRAYANVLRNLDSVFDTIKPPPPSLLEHINEVERRDAARAGRVANVYVPPDDMSHFNNRGGVCFGGESTVLMADSSIKRIDEIRAGDRVRAGYTAPGETMRGEAVVQRVVKTVYADAQQMFTEGRDEYGKDHPETQHITVTEWHPVRIDMGPGYWQFPSEALRKSSHTPTEIYSLMMERDSHPHFILCTKDLPRRNVMDGASLAHNDVDEPDEVLTHDYYGTDRVRSDLLRLPHNDGVITINGQKTVYHRDEVGGPVTSVDFAVVESTIESEGEEKEESSDEISDSDSDDWKDGTIGDLPDSTRLERIFSQVFGVSVSEVRRLDKETQDEIADAAAASVKST